MNALSDKVQKSILEFVGKILRLSKDEAIEDINIVTKGENARTGLVWYNGENSINHNTQDVIRAHVQAVMAGRKPKFEERNEGGLNFYYYGGKSIGLGDSGMTLEDIASGVTLRSQKERLEHSRVLEALQHSIDEKRYKLGEEMTVEKTEEFLKANGYQLTNVESWDKHTRGDNWSKRHYAKGTDRIEVEVEPDGEVYGAEFYMTKEEIEKLRTPKEEKML